MQPATWIRFALIAALSAGRLLAADMPATADDALEIVSSARRAVEALPVLTGTEEFSIDVLRHTLRDSWGVTPSDGFQSAQDVVTSANAAGGTTVQQLMLFNVAWAALESNWLFATLLGDKEASVRLQRESNSLIAYQAAYMTNVKKGAAFASFYPRLEANQHAMTLRITAANMNYILLIPNAMDPEGFLRQRLQVVYN